MFVSNFASLKSVWSRDNWWFHAVQITNVSFELLQLLTSYYKIFINYCLPCFSRNLALMTDQTLSVFVIKFYKSFLHNVFPLHVGLQQRL